MEKQIDGKKCNKCNTLRELSEFYFRKDTGKHRPDCKKCRNTFEGDRKRKRREYNKSQWQKNKDINTQKYKDWYDKNYHSEYQEGRRRKNNYSKYGLTVDEYIDMYSKTDGKCYICDHKEVVERNGKVKRLAIDHCHTTGKVRGLLCQNCNRGIGLLKDDTEVLAKAIKYLEESNNE